MQTPQMVSPFACRRLQDDPAPERAPDPRATPTADLCETVRAANAAPPPRTPHEPTMEAPPQRKRGGPLESDNRRVSGVTSQMSPSGASPAAQQYWRMLSDVLVTHGAQILTDLGITADLQAGAALPSIEVMRADFVRLTGALERFDCCGDETHSPHLNALLQARRNADGSTCNRLSDAPGLEADWVAHIGASEPSLLLHPKPLGFAINTYFDTLMRGRIPCVVSLVPMCPWWPTAGVARTGDIVVRACQVGASTLRAGEHELTVQGGAYTLSRGGDEHTVHYMHLPCEDFTPIPADILAAAARDVIDRARGGRIAVHCFAGQGRTGMFAAAAMRALTTHDTSLATFSDYGQGLLTLLALRCQRRNAVETGDQFAALFVRP